MPFQDALSHGGWRSAPRVGWGGTQGRSAADPPRLRSGLVRGESGGNRCHSRRRRSSRFRGRRGSIRVGLEEGLPKAPAEREATKDTCTTRLLRLNHWWCWGNLLRSHTTVAPACARGSTTLVMGVGNFDLLAVIIFEDRRGSESRKAPIWKRGTSFRGGAHKVGEDRRTCRRRGHEIGWVRGGCLDIRWGRR